ncbi:MAG: tetratricopeptide repeat protein [Sedimentisphaerales bacterium]|jgi:tetratricopeptide (TPR) repeat protein
MKLNAKLIFICLTLALASFIAYEPMRHNGFVDYDDNDYVTGNAQVLRGLTKDGVVWSFTETDLTANWHPLTWLSHMLDIELFGANPFWHHLVSLLFHITNTLLLFWIFNKMSKALWQSFFVAAAFALHPLHIESVAWVAERKDVLSGLFWMLTIAAYITYATNPTIKRYVLVVLSFIMGLMAKPMLVTLPLVLLLLDYWPLERLKLGQQYKRGSFWRLIAEKLPLLLLSMISSAITFVVQKHAGAMIRGENYSLMTRISNAFVAYICYIAKLFYPAKLAVLYPHPGSNLPLWQPIAAFAVIVFMTAVVFYLASKKRFLLVGWLWYLGTLVPVIGVVQVGSQAMADRYTYLPSIGIFIMLAWGIDDFLAGWKYKKVLIGLTTSIALIALLIGTRVQLSYWQNTRTLYRHTLEITRNNYVIYNNYGCCLQEHGELDSAVENFNKALQLKPDYVAAMNNLGMALMAQGRIDEAAIQWEKVLAMEPYHPNANANLGRAFAAQGRYEEAVNHFNTALKIKPDLPGAYYMLGDIYYRMGNHELAAENFRQAIRIQPDNVTALNNLGIIYGEQGKINEAIQKWNEALVIDPNLIHTHLNLALALAQEGQHRPAIEHYSFALRLDPNQPEVLVELAASYAATGNLDQAIKITEKALNLAISAGNNEMASQIQEQLQSYKNSPSSNTK